jgi:hypothetical protein
VLAFKMVAMEMISQLTIDGSMKLTRSGWIPTI